MAITVDWGNKIVSVPQSFLTLVGGSVYTLDTESFKIAINDLEDSEQGMLHPQIINHSTKVSLGGIEYARVVEFINGYTITFENGSYVVNLVGSNNNILDVTNLNNVQVRSNNSAGLINVAEVQAQMYDDKVSVDVTSSNSGTLYPIGTPLKPVNNIPDAIAIAASKGYTSLQIIGDITVGNGDDVSGMTLIGQNPVRTTITINADALTQGCEILNAEVTGNLDGGTILRECVISDLNYINGFVYNCMLNPGTISLGGSDTAHFLNCYSGVPGVGTPCIDMDGAGAEDTPLAMRGYNGGICLEQKTGTAACSIDLASGQVRIADTCTTGSVVVRGDGKVVRNEDGAHLMSGTINGGLTLLNEANYGDHVHDIWEYIGKNPDNPTNQLVNDVMNYDGT